MSHRFLLVLIIVLLTLLTVTPVMAGGWAVISLDSLPGEIIAGQPVSIGFTVLQHGRTPLDGLDPVLRLTHIESGEDLTVYAKAEGNSGHYSAILTLPEAGSWRWSIQAFNMDQPMPDLVATETVAQAVAPPTNPVQNSPGSAPLIIGMAGMACASIGIVYMWKSRSRWAIAAIILGLLVGVAGFARAGIATASERISEANQPAEAAKPVDLIEQGEGLFVAKGCVSCHLNRRVDSRYLVFSTEIGPDLTNYPTSSEYLQLWLSNPASVKPKTEMPNLNLSQTEIGALIAFLLQDSSE